MKKDYIPMLSHYVQAAMAEDTLLPRAIAYYRQQGDSTKLFDSYLFEARYLQWINQLDNKISLSPVAFFVISFKFKDRESGRSFEVLLHELEDHKMIQTIYP